MNIIKKNTLFIFTIGSFDNEVSEGLVQAKVDINVDSLKEEYLSEYCKQAIDSQFDYYAFIQWLYSTKKVIKKVKYLDWYLGYQRNASFLLQEGVQIDVT